MTLEANGKTKTEKYRRILEAAIKVFAEQGFFHSTISQIAKEAGVADGTIYLYFKNKDDILIQFYNYKTRNIFDKLNQTFYIPDNKKSWSKLAYKKIVEVLGKEKYDALFITCPPFSAFEIISKIKK